VLSMITNIERSDLFDIGAMDTVENAIKQCERHRN
jgi:hypothetical protein